MQERITALYARVSTDAQKEEGYSIDAQNNSMAALCEAKTFGEYEYYTDAGFTGADMNRPELKRLIQNIKDRKICRVIVYKLDRLSRNLRDTMYMIEDILLPQGVDFVSLTENLDTSTPMGRAMIAILSAFAQLERENIRDRTRMGMKERVRNGYWMGGGRIPYGYDYDKELGILVPNQDATKVRQMYDLYLQGYSTYQIAEFMGLKYDRLADQILKRKSNIGVIEYNGEEYKGRHEPLVSAETYYKTINYMQERSVTHTSTGGFLLTGCLVCGKCGAKMRYQKWGKNRWKIVCYSRHKSKPYLVKDSNCDNFLLWSNDIEDAVINDIFKFSYKHGDIITESSIKISVIEMLEKQYQEKIKAVKRLYILYAESENSVLLETINELNKTISDIETQISTERKINLISNQMISIQNKLKTIKESWEFMTMREKKSIVQSCIESIKITYNGIDIKYKFDALNKQEHYIAEVNNTLLKAI